MQIIVRIAEELSVHPEQVATAVALLDEGGTVPFIARYRKEATGGLNDVQLRALELRLAYLRDLEERRATVLATIRSQEKLTPELERAILEADTKSLLEDLYLPYKPKRRTKAQIAREAGLEPLADGLLRDPESIPEDMAAQYLAPELGFGDPGAVLEGARQILMERFAEDAALLQGLREQVWASGILVSTVVAGKEETGAKFKDYFAYEEPIRVIPSHRALAMFRGRQEAVLNLSLKAGRDEGVASADCEAQIAARFGIADRGRAADGWLVESVRLAWKIKLLTRIELDLQQRLRESAEAEAIRVFAHNLKDLLLSAPAGPRVTLGLDPGLRTGVKLAVVDATGKLVETATIYPHVPKKQWEPSIAQLADICRRHGVEIISIGNGTASRETDQLVADLRQRFPELGLQKIVVSEAGASVYSASELASREFPDVDVSLRGAVSIARRLQDPLAELVKIEPKAIGVGQYQHDVNQTHLARSLDAVVEDCVNAVGVDANTASSSLLGYVSGLSRTIGENIVEFRNQHGPFRNREQLKQVPRLGAKTFELAAGFLRVAGGDNPLDASAVHPEAYPLVQRILSTTGTEIGAVIGNAAFLRKLDAQQFVDPRFGLPTIGDILHELEKPGRDPRPEFRAAAFRDGVHAMDDLQPGMMLEGQVTNVTNFGAFVDIGVHQDGLVHISHLADRFVSDPREVVKAGDIVSVRVLEVDLQRKRIALSMKREAPAQAPAQAAPSSSKGRGATPKRSKEPRRDEAPQPAGAMAAALARAMKGNA